MPKAMQLLINTIPALLRACFWRRTSVFGRAGLWACFFACAPVLAPSALAAASLPDSTALPPAAGQLEAFFSGTIGKTVLMFAVFLLVMLFLRLLYGPKGLLREKRWDEMNAEFKSAQDKTARLKAARNIYKKRGAELAPLLAAEGAILNAWVESFLNGQSQNDDPIAIKLQHSANVLKNAWIIAAREEVFYSSAQRDMYMQDSSALPGASPLPLDKALLLAALYHDIGRFEQIKRFGTFKDADSASHALLGARTLADQRFMGNESAAMRRLVRGAVLLHNRLALPAAMPQSLALVTKALRDADKLDIINIMRQELAPGRPVNKTVSLGLEDLPEVYSRHALEAVLEGRAVEYSKMCSVNDFRLLLCSWVNTLEFASARQELRRRGHMQEIMQGLPLNSEMELVRQKVRERLILP